MSSAEQTNGFASRDEEVEFYSRVLQFMESSMNADETAAFNLEMQQSEVKLNAFASMQFQGSVIRHSLRQSAYETVDLATSDSAFAIARPDAHRERLNAMRVSTRRIRALIVLAATGLLIAGVFVSTAVRNASSTYEAPIAARLIHSSNAAFFGELLPAADAPLGQGRDYVLTQGLVELLFPSGATAIIESPSVFRIINNECLAMDAGRCSVHAPDGAEGFRVLTPTTQVVDRGTRFMVSVDENAFTEVQMIEGAADVYQANGQYAGVHLANQDARRFSSANEATEVIPSSPMRYRMNLPDRIVSYDAAESPGGGVDDLRSVTVQRDGRLQTYSTAELIGVRVAHFRGEPLFDQNGHLACGDVVPEDRLSLLSDHRLATGIINPGGSVKPLTTSPGSETPGFCIQFNAPVVNKAGPDVVFFELQCLANPIDGDAFHVSPMKFTNSSKSKTIKNYDLTLISPETKALAGFSLYRFADPINTVQQLATMECQGSPVRLGFRAIAVGIDLTDLGFADGESVSELFFQDASDDAKSLVDPVFIAGLPSS